MENDIDTILLAIAVGNISSPYNVLSKLKCLKDTIANWFGGIRSQLLSEQ